MKTFNNVLTISSFHSHPKINLVLINVIIGEMFVCCSATLLGFLVELLKSSVAMQEQMLGGKGFLVIGYLLEKVWIFNLLIKISIQCFTGLVMFSDIFALAKIFLLIPVHTMKYVCHFFPL